MIGMVCAERTLGSRLYCIVRVLVDKSTHDRPVHVALRVLTRDVFAAALASIRAYISWALFVFVKTV